jgi:uncharacterized protein
VIGLPSFIVGSMALGLVLVGMVAASAEGASLPIILAATAIGQCAGQSCTADPDGRAAAHAGTVHAAWYPSIRMG